MRLMVLGALLALLAATRPLAAQLPAEVGTGTRVRIAIDDSVRQLHFVAPTQWLYGTVVARAADTLYVSLLNLPAPLAVPRASMRSLSVSRGLPSPTRSAFVQGARGAVLGALMFAVLQDIDENSAFPGRGEAALAGGVAGAGLGVYLGLRQPLERWRAVSLGR
jgi:hypothetical protein